MIRNDQKTMEYNLNQIICTWAKSFKLTDSLSVTLIRNYSCTSGLQS